jgi:MFS family permease
MRWQPRRFIEASRMTPVRIPVALLSLTLACGAAMRAIFSPLQEMAKTDLHLNDVQMSLIQGAAVALPVALLSIPIGRLADRFNRVKLLAVMGGLAVVGTFLTAAAQSFSMLFLARMLAGFGVIAVPAAVSLVADVSVPQRRGRAMLVLLLGLSLGIAAAFALGGWLLGWLDAAPSSWFGSMKAWRVTQVIFGVGCGILMVPLLFVQEPARRELGSAADAKLLPVLSELWRRRGFLVPLLIGGISALMADTAATIWAAPILIRNHGLQPAQFGGWLGLSILVSGILGSVGGGYLADLGQRLKARGGILQGAVLAVAISIPAAFFPLAPTVPIFAAMLAVLLLCGGMSTLITATVIAVRLPNELRGMFMGLFNVLGSIVSYGIAPTVVAVVSATLGGDAHLAGALALTGALISVVSLAGFVTAMIRLPKRVGVTAT